MKRYLAFYGEVYYPGAGMQDSIGDFHTKDEAISAINDKNKNLPSSTDDWGCVWDSMDRSRVYTAGKFIIIKEY